MNQATEVSLLDRVPKPVRETLVALFAGMAFFAPISDGVGERTPLGYALIAAYTALLLVRTRFPWAVLAGAVALQCALVLTFTTSPVSTLALLIAVYTVSARSPWRIAVSMGVLVAAALLITLGVVIGGLIVRYSVPVAVQVALAVALGQTARIRAAYIAEITDRALRAEATREAEARRRVAEDRLRIARDLHDAVAHQITVISLNAGVASSAIADRPDAAREALQTIRESSRLVLREIGDMLATLRSPEETPEAPAARGLTAVPDLIGQFERSGLAVTYEMSGDPAPISTAVDIVAYRVIQEGLTNALRHGPGTADLEVEIGPRRVSIRLSNPLVKQSHAGTGHGLVGMAERVASVRGAVEYGVTEGSFVVAASLPIAEPVAEPVTEPVTETGAEE
ncbi:sensor histidine kinase [Nocardioides sp. NPDC059952]|uniref:sensor histidine kinase n=1 Tax=Nocardioides sp. NPDC059952 TaxID=3347014 RepID=UPI0036672928